MKKGIIYILLAAIFFSTMEIALKLVSSQFNPVQLTFVRFLMGAILLTPLAVRQIKARKLRIVGDDLRFFALTGFICVVVSMILYQMAILSCKASTVAILFCCNPVFIAPLAFFILKEDISRATLVSIIVNLAGIALILNPLHVSGSLGGIVLIALAAATFALYSVIGKLRCDRYGGIVMTTYTFYMGAAQLLAIMLISHFGILSALLTRAGLNEFASIPFFQGFSLQNLPALIYIGLFVTGLGYTFYFMAMEETSASLASIVFFIKPALASFLAWIILGEAITPLSVLGIVLIVCGSSLGLLWNSRSSQALHDADNPISAD